MRWESRCDGCGLEGEDLTDEQAIELIRSHVCPRFEPGQRVRSKLKLDHIGKVVKQEHGLVTWDCETCGIGADYAKDLELVTG